MQFNRIKNSEEVLFHDRKIYIAKGGVETMSLDAYLDRCERAFEKPNITTDSIQDRLLLNEMLMRTLTQDEVREVRRGETEILTNAELKDQVTDDPFREASFKENLRIFPTEGGHDEQ